MIECIIGAVLGGLSVGYIYRIQRRGEADGLRGEIKRLKRDLDYTEKRKSYWADETCSLVSIISDLRAEKQELQAAYKELGRYVSQLKQEGIDEEVLAAIKYAMKNSHPDKPNGNAEEFRRFHDLYKHYSK